MKIILEFDKYEDKEEYELALKAGSYKSALEDVGNYIFRPARKHGYSEGAIRDYLDKLKPAQQRLVLQAIGALEEDFYKLLENNEVKLYE